MVHKFAIRCRRILTEHSCSLSRPSMSFKLPYRLEERSSVPPPVLVAPRQEPVNCQALEGLVQPVRLSERPDSETVCDSTVQDGRSRFGEERAGGGVKIREITDL